jgi:myo-inositol-hexaphosphate 3-phosphohydrolase
LNAPGIVDQDDMCIWVHPTNHSLSTVITSDKSANKLFVYDLSGNVLQIINISGSPGNIDIRYNLLLSGVLTDIIGYNDRTNGTIVFYKINKTTRQLSFISNFSDGGMTGDNYGFCLYHSPVSGKYYAIASSNSTQMKQWELVDNGNGTIGGIFKRTWNNGSGDITEGLVADDELGVLFAANEGEGIYKYNAEPDEPNPVGELIAPTGSNGLTEDVEGLTIYYSSQGNGYIIASSQGSNNFKVYERQAPHNYIKTVQVTGVGNTDGIDVINLNLDYSFPYGMFLVHDGTGSPFAIKVCKWEDLLLDVDTSYWNPRHSPFSYTSNTFAVIGDYGSEGINEQRVADMVKSWNPEFVITTGDNTYGSNPIDENIGQYYSKFIYPYTGNYPPSSPDQNRFWISVGNHDYDDGGGIDAIQNYFPYLLPNTYFDIVIGDVHFFFLDSEEFYQYSDAQKIWFDNAVANSTARWRIAVFHRPPYTSGGGGNTANEHNMRTWPFNQNNFQLMFNGHIHNMEHLTVPGEQTHYCVQGAGGRSLYTFENDPSPATRVWGLDYKYGACKVIVTSTTLTIEFWSTDGTTNSLEHSFILNNPITNSFQLSVDVENGWNMVSIPGLHPVDQNVLTWWPGKDPTSNVFNFNGTYHSVTTVTPGAGYWMKHIDPNTYNTGDEWPSSGIQMVTHNPINGSTGWNLIGGYENSIPVSEITTSPPGLINGPIYKFNSVFYQVADTLKPGYAYWIKLSGDGQIIFP